MICPNCGKILNEGEICTCTASTEPVQAPVEPIQEAVQEPVQENAQEPVQEPVQAPTNAQPYYQQSENVIEPQAPQAESEPYQNPDDHFFLIPNFVLLLQHQNLKQILLEHLSLPILRFSIP